MIPAMMIIGLKPPHSTGFGEKSIVPQDEDGVEVVNVLPIKAEDVSLAAIVDYIYNTGCTDDVARESLSSEGMSSRKVSEILGALKLKRHTEMMKNSVGKVDEFDIEF